MLCCVVVTQRSTNRGKDGRPSVMVLRALLLPPPPPLAAATRRRHSPPPLAAARTKKKLGTPTKTRVRSGARHQLLFNCSTMLNWGASPLFWAAPALWVLESTARGLTSWPQMGTKGPMKMLCTVKLGDKERFDKEQIGVKEQFPATNLLIYFIRISNIWH